jgi:hypothetical protein
MSRVITIETCTICKRIIRVIFGAKVCACSH